MIDFVRNLVDDTVQCIGCPVFDRMFQVVSHAAGAVYSRFAAFCTILLCVLLAFFVLNVVWKGLKNGAGNITDSIKGVFINALIAVTLFGMGIALPRFVGRITFEPAANIALIYTQAMIESDNEIVNERVTYKPVPMADNGFFRPELRDTVIMLMKTTITQFQAYIKLGIAVMDAAFTWRMLLGIGALVKHILWFVLGLYLFYAFGRLFVRFAFYFADIIVAMAFFAFFFPLSVAMIAFKGGRDVPAWIANIGKGLGADQLKKLINAIITLSAAILTYTVIMVIIAKFFSAPDESAADLMLQIMDGDVFASDLSEDNLASMSLIGAAVLVYVITFLYEQVPQVTKIVLSAFNVSEENKISEQLADDAMRLTGLMVDSVKKVGGTILNGGEKPDEKKDGKKDGGK